MIALFTEVEVDMVEAVEEGADPKCQRRPTSTQNQQLLVDKFSKAMSQLDGAVDRVSNKRKCVFLQQHLPRCLHTAAVGAD